ncbi:MAG: hypothetical protein LBR65_03720 [Culturomica sp.]|jgi:hypothetical protein|nr:hypothetical protein [Culturomica sp.]
MARATDELKNISGTLGNLVFYQRNGATYVRTKPTTYRDAKTEKQLLLRGRFAGCNYLYKCLQADIFRRVWKMAAKGTGKNAKNMFVRHNIHAFGKEQEITDYQRLHFSTGLLPLPRNLELECRNTHDCLLHWEYDPQEAIGSPGDRLYLVEFQSNLRIRIHETGVCRREREALFSTFYTIDKGTHLYAFWGNETGTSFSPSYYFPLGR